MQYQTKQFMVWKIYCSSAYWWNQEGIVWGLHGCWACPVCPGAGTVEPWVSGKYRLYDDWVVILLMSSSCKYKCPVCAVWNTGNAMYLWLNIPMLHYALVSFPLTPDTMQGQFHYLNLAAKRCNRNLLRPPSKCTVVLMASSSAC